MIEIVNKPSTPITSYNIIDSIKNFGENFFLLISEALAGIAATFSQLMEGKSIKPIIVQDISEKTQVIEVSSEREQELEIIVKATVRMAYEQDLYPFYIEYILGCFDTMFKKVKIEENDYLWKKYSSDIKNIIRSERFPKELSDFPNLDMFIKNFKKKAIEEETTKHIYLLLALNCKEMPELPNDIKGYIFDFAKASLEKQEPQIAKAFFQRI